MELFQRPIPVLSYGMGVESTGILVRWILEPDTRDFELSELIVVTAQTGQEFPDTKQCVEKYLAPLLKASDIRWVQIARAAQSVTEGFRVLSDTRSAEVCYTGGQYRLGQELEAAGTVPEYAHGKRKCSIKSKGDPLDAWIAQELGEKPFRHFLGFNAEEEKRVTRDLSYSSVERQSEYPLLDWAWTRERTQEYLQSVFHICLAKKLLFFLPIFLWKGRTAPSVPDFPAGGSGGRDAGVCFDGFEPADEPLQRPFLAEFDPCGWQYTRPGAI